MRGALRPSTLAPKLGEHQTVTGQPVLFGFARFCDGVCAGGRGQLGDMLGAPAAGAQESAEQEKAARFLAEPDANHAAAAAAAADEGEIVLQSSAAEAPGGAPRRQDGPSPNSAEVPVDDAT
eukprot:3940847-Rhodomonas_salina.1